MGVEPSSTRDTRAPATGAFPLVFFAAKDDELVSVFSGADVQTRLEAMNILLRADPANGMKYQALQKGN